MACRWRNGTVDLNEDAYLYSGISINWPYDSRKLERLVYNGRAVTQKLALATSFNLTLSWDRSKGLSLSGR
jgi:hypothetical protein